MRIFKARNTISGHWTPSVQRKDLQLGGSNIEFKSRLNCLRAALPTWCRFAMVWTRQYGNFTDVALVRVYQVGTHRRSRHGIAEDDEVDETTGRGATGGVVWFQVDGDFPLLDDAVAVERVGRVVHGDSCTVISI